MQTAAPNDERAHLSCYRIKRQVPWILAEANRFVEREAEDDLDAWARRFDIPAAIVDALATSIWYQGKPRTETRKQMWMLLRWRSAPSPDLRLWAHLDPRDLMVPVDGHVACFAAADRGDPGYQGRAFLV